MRAWWFHTSDSSRFPMRSVPRSVSSRAHFSPRGKISRVADYGKHPDLSAFIVVAWCTLRNTSALKVSALIRTIATEATIYFLAMVALQVYSQLSLVFMEV